MRKDLHKNPDERKAPQPRRFPLYRLLLILLLLVFAGLQYRLWVGDGSMAEVHRLKQTRANLQSTIDQSETRNKALAAEIDNLKHGKEALGGRARSEIGMIKRGEVFYRTVAPKKQTERTRDHSKDRSGNDE